MLHPYDNKENVTNHNTLYSRHHNKSKTNLLQSTLTHSTTTLNFAEEIALKIYQERIKNKRLYDKIREIDCFFGYELRPQLRYYSDQEMQVKQYGKLLEEYEFLEKHWTKIETLIDRNTQQQHANFHFLIAPWQKKQNLHTTNHSTQILQRLNKTVLVIKKEIDAQLRSKTKNDENFTYRQFVMNSPEYVILQKQLQTVEDRLKEREEELQSRVSQSEMQSYKRQNETLKYKLEQLQAKLRQMTNKQKQLYIVMSKMSKQLVETQLKLQEYRTKQQHTKRNLSSNIEGDDLPLFQSQIRSKTDIFDKLNTSVPRKSLQEIQKFILSNNSSHNAAVQQNNSEKEAEQISKNNTANYLLQTPKQKQTTQLSHDQPTQQFSSKKRRISTKRQIYSGTKLFPKRVSQDYEQLAKEVKFIRKR